VGLDPGTTRSRTKLKADAYPTKPPRRPSYEHSWTTFYVYKFSIPVLFDSSQKERFGDVKTMGSYHCTQGIPAFNSNYFGNKHLNKYGEDSLGPTLYHHRYKSCTNGGNYFPLEIYYIVNEI